MLFILFLVFINVFFWRRGQFMYSSLRFRSWGDVYNCAALPRRWLALQAAQRSCLITVCY